MQTTADYVKSCMICSFFSSVRNRSYPIYAICDLLQQSAALRSFIGKGLKILIYLDNSATTRPCNEAIKAAAENMADNFGNPSSLHKMGIEAEKVIKSAKKTILKKLGMEGEIYFTSGATESNNTVISMLPITYKHNGKKIVTTAIEHPSVSVPIDKLCEKGYTAVRLMPKDCDSFEQAITDAVDDNTVLVSVMWINNETGYITDTAKVYNAVKRKNPKTVVHVDAVQGFCKGNPKTLKGDFISLSAHKIHGIKGTGALYVKKGMRFEPFLYGGGQQKNLRSGTEAVDLIAGFEAAVKAYPDCTEKYAALNSLLQEKLSELSGISFNSFNNSKNILNFSVKGVRSEIMLHFLEEREIYVSSGSACSKGKVSGVLSALGISDENADSAIRVSFSPYTTEAEIIALADGIKDGIERFRR